MGEPRRIRWTSDGAASAVATMLDIRDHGVAAGPIVTCTTGAEDPDNIRFRSDCEPWFGGKVDIIGSDKYDSTWDVWERRGYMAGINGAVCTGELKVVPRLNFCLPSDIHVFGYTADGPDVARAKRLRLEYPEMKVVTPLIDRGVTKEGCLAILEQAGIAPPRTYAMGFPNANCLQSGCCKATSPAYWALHREHFPEGFARTAAIARKLGVRLARIGDERVFIEDIPADYPTRDAIAPRCDLLCALAQDEIDNADAALTLPTDEVIHAPSEEEIDAAMTTAGGWTRATLAGWGVPWPPPKGWRKALIEGNAPDPRQALSRGSRDVES